MLALWGYKDARGASPTARFFFDGIASGNAVFWTIDNGGELTVRLLLDMVEDLMEEYVN